MDAVQKVEAAYMSGTSSATTFGARGPVLFSAGASTTAASLAPPAAPICRYASGTLFLALVVSILAVLFAIASYGMLNSPEMRRNPKVTRTVEIVLGCSIVAAVFPGVPLWVYHRRQQAKFDAAHARQLTFHRHMCHVWQQLYFCSRDHIVFSPLTRNWEDLRSVHRLIQDEAARYYGPPPF